MPSNCSGANGIRRQVEVLVSKNLHDEIAVIVKRMAAQYRNAVLRGGSNYRKLRYRMKPNSIPPRSNINRQTQYRADRVAGILGVVVDFA